MTPKQIVSILEDNLEAAYAENQSLRETNRELAAQIAKMHSDYAPVIEQVNAQVAAIKRESAQ